MASITSVQLACSKSNVLSKVESREFSGWTMGFSLSEGIFSRMSNSGCSSTLLFRQAFEIGHGVLPCRTKSAVVRCSVSKQKKKVKEKRRSGAAEKQWKFDELMLVWDDAFQKLCDDTCTATSLLTLSRNGCAHYGRGCVLVEETVNTKPRGAASGFSNKSRYSSSDAPELPFYISLGWNASYVPLDFINDPLKAPESSATLETEPVEVLAIKLVDQAKLLSVLRGMDRTRLHGLLTAPVSEAAKDAGGEEPYDPSKNEVVVMFALTVDGQQAVGADVLRAYAAAQGNDDGKILWTLLLRDGDGSDLIP